MTNNASTYVLTKSVERFPEYPIRRETSQPAMKPDYPIRHRSRRRVDD